MGMGAYFRSQTSYRFNLEKNNLIMFSQAKMAQGYVTEMTGEHKYISAGTHKSTHMHVR